MRDIKIHTILATKEDFRRWKPSGVGVCVKKMFKKDVETGGYSLETDDLYEHFGYDLAEACGGWDTLKEFEGEDYDENQGWCAGVDYIEKDLPKTFIHKTFELW